MKRYLIGILLIATVSLVLYIVADSLSPGTFANSVNYELNISIEELVKLIEDFKTKSPGFCVNNSYNLNDHRDGYRYVVYFYFEKEGEILYTYLKSSGKEKTTWALVAVKKKNSNDWLDLNEELSKKETIIRIEEFESSILEFFNQKISN